MTEQRAFANQEREYQARRLGKLGRALLLMLATLLSLIALGLLGADQLYRPDTFKIDQIKITGQFRYIDPSIIEAQLASKIRGNFFSIDLDEIQADAESIEWVERVDVRREWPNTLLLSVSEHKPAMRWGTDKWVSTAGVIIELPEFLDASNVITLDGSNTQAKRIMLQAERWKRDLANHGLDLKRVEFSESEAWTLTLYSRAQDAQFDLLLGHEDVAERLQRFEFLFNKQFRFSERPIKRADARYPDGLAVEQAESEISNTRALSSLEVIASNTEH